MKKQGGTTKYAGDERLREGPSIFKKFFDSAKKPSIINTETIKVAKDVVAAEATSEFNVFVNQIFGIELQAGKTHNISRKETGNYNAKDTDTKTEKPEMTAEHMQYFSEFKSLTEGKKTDEITLTIKQQLDSILAELRNLKNSSDELQSVFKDVVVDEVPDKPGIYHLTFYEGFLKLVMRMRDKVEDGVVYAKLFKSRRSEKNYSAMAKKGGTSFTQHHDRAVATQTG